MPIIIPIEYMNAFSNDIQIKEDIKWYLNKKYQGDSVSLKTNAWIRLCAAWVCSGVPDIIITVSVAPGLGSVIVIFASEIWKVSVTLSYRGLVSMTRS